MNNITIEVPISIDSIIKQLDDKNKIELVKRLERETRKQRWNSLLVRLGQRFAKNPIPEKEITQICRAARKQRYEKNIKNGY